MLSLQPALTRRSDEVCPHCGQVEPIVTSVVLDGSGSAAAVVTSSLTRHDDDPVVWLDAILGTWDTSDGMYGDHVTFSCRVGHVRRSDDLVVSLVDATPGESPFAGRALTADEAREHPLVERFFEVVDLVLLHEPDVHDHATRAAGEELPPGGPVEAPTQD